MKQLSIFLLFLLAFGMTAMAQEAEAEDKKEEEVTPHWETGGLGTITINQTGLVNWAQGGVSNVSGGAFLNVFANKKMPTAYWDNSLDLAYGLIYQYPDDEPNSFIKGDDKIDFLSKWGKNTGNENWFYSANLNFRSQFAPGFASVADQDANNYLSRVMAPSFTTLAIGMDYKPNDKFSAFVSPLTGKFTTVLDDSLSRAGAYGVIGETRDTSGVLLTEAQKTRWELGASARVKFKDEVMKNVTYETQFDVFANYLAKNQYDVKFPEGENSLTNPKFSPLAFFDVNWTNSVLMKVNKYITVTLFTHLFYDWDVRLDGEVASDGRPNAKLRFKEVSGIGLSYKFAPKEPK